MKPGPKKGTRHAGNFKPGQSGNPGGRPKTVKLVRELAAQYTEEAIETLRELMRNARGEKVRQACADSLLDRAHGRPTQMMGQDPENPFALVPPQTVEEALEFVKTTSGGDTGKR